MQNRAVTSQRHTKTSPTRNLVCYMFTVYGQYLQSRPFSVALVIQIIEHHLLRMHSGETVILVFKLVCADIFIQIFCITIIF